MELEDDLECDLTDDDGYCACGAIHSIEELDSGVCDCCGGIVDDA